MTRENDRLSQKLEGFRVSTLHFCPNLTKPVSFSRESLYTMGCGFPLKATDDGLSIYGNVGGGSHALYPAMYCKRENFRSAGYLVHETGRSFFRENRGGW